METYAANDTALLIVDPYNDFMSEGGKAYGQTRQTAEAVGFAHAILTTGELLALLRS